MKNRELENRLQEWADFVLRDSDGLGYPSMNVLGRLQRDGGVLERGYGAKYPPENPQAQQIEEWVSELATSKIRVYERAAKVLRTRYIFTTSDTLDAQIARKMGFSIRTYYLYLKTAKNWIEHKLENPVVNLPLKAHELKKNVIKIDFKHVVNF